MFGNKNFHPSLRFFFFLPFFFFELSGEKEFKPVGQRWSSSRRAAFIYSIVFFSMEKGKYSTNLEMFPVKSRPGSLTAIGQNIISINWQGMAAVFSLGLSGYILRRLQETGAKFLDGERTKGDCSSPKWDPLFRRTTGKFDASKLILMHVCIYIYIYVSQCQPRNVYSDRIRISVCVNASTSSRRDTFVHTMKPAPALDSIKLR